jgi:hypothetical protein
VNTKPTFPDVERSSPEHGARLLARSLREKLNFSTEGIEKPKNDYVAWLDLMGAGNMMSISIHKAANAIARIQLAVHLAQQDHRLNLRTVPINDGVFFVSEKKSEIVNVLRSSIIYLVGNFIARRNHPDRFLARGGIAYGPVWFGTSLATQLSKIQKGASDIFQQVIIGSPIIQAYKAESLAPVYGVAVHESARAFSPETEEPFRSTLWRWWQTNDGGGFSEFTPQPVIPLRDTFLKELDGYLDYLDSTLPFHLIAEGKVAQWKKDSQRYYR